MESIYIDYREIKDYKILLLNIANFNHKEKRNIQLKEGGNENII